MHFVRIENFLITITIIEKRIRLRNSINHKQIYIHLGNYEYLYQ